jgi:MFS family permease
VPFVHLVPYARDHGIDPTTSVVLLGLIGVGSTLGRFVVGAAADRFGRKRSLGLTFAGLGASCLWWLASDQAWQLAVFALAMGTCYGGFVALCPAVMADYFGVRAVSGIVGALYTAVGVGTLIGPTLAGAAYDRWQSYAVPIAVSAVAALAAAAIVLAQQNPESWRTAVRETVAPAAPAR